MIKFYGITSGNQWMHLNGRDEQDLDVLFVGCMRDKSYSQCDYYKVRVSVFGFYTVITFKK